MNEQRIWRWAALALAAAALAGLWHASTQRAQAEALRQASPTAIAVIDVSRVLEQLEERQAKEDAFNLEVERRRGKIVEMNGQLEALYQEIEVMPESDRKKEKFEEAVRLNMLMEFEDNFARRIFSEQRKDLLLEMFAKIKAATNAYAEAEGWDIVMVTDHAVDIPQNLNPSEAEVALLTRRVLSVSDAVDITDEVAQRMNNEYRR